MKLAVLLMLEAKKKVKIFQIFPLNTMLVTSLLLIHTVGVKQHLIFARVNNKVKVLVLFSPYCT